MARIPASANDKIFTISKWLGVNESGDTNLRMGEASTMTNFKITHDDSLQKRPGTQIVASLVSAHVLDVEDGTTTVLTETGTASTASFECYPNYSISDMGVLSLTGAKVTVNFDNIAGCANYYTQYGSAFYRLGTCQAAPPPGEQVTGGYINTVEPMVYNLDYAGGYPAKAITCYTAVAVQDGVIVPASDPSVYPPGGFPPWGILGRYLFKNNKCYKIMYFDAPDGEYLVYFHGKEVVVSTDGTFTWKFYRCSVKANTADSVVRGIWSGYAGTTEMLCAACNGKLLALTENGGVWSKTTLGTIDTTGRVLMFGFGGKLYVIDGSNYYAYNGTTFSTVAGYVPLAAVSVPPAGGGTALQRVNMLTAKRRVWFSPDGSATTFRLPEKDLQSIDSAKVIATGESLTIQSSSTANGTVTFASAPSAGTNTVEVEYTAKTSMRNEFVKMQFAELYNGVNDNRVFLYGDGTNRAIYSDLDYNGQATAEYFPDLNVVHIGDNTPVTGMVRHYDRLLAFKIDSAYSLSYDTITLVTGAVTAGFYVTPVNRGIGSAGYGQAVVVGNSPRTLDSRAIYEWTSTTPGGIITTDQRNAIRISQKVQKTIGEIALDKAVAFYDKVNQEYYVVENGTAIIQNTYNGAWYIYRSFPAVCMTVYKDELYFGTANGDLRHVSRNYLHDAGQPVTCYWESGSMSFGSGHVRKYSDAVWIVLKPEDNANVRVTVQTDRQSDYGDETVIADYTGEVTQGFFDFLDLNLSDFTFNVNDKPQTARRRLKVRNFAWYKLIFSTVSGDSTATILEASVKVRPTGFVR